MASFNKVMLIGNVTRDPETRMMPSGESMTRTGLAVNRRWLDKEGNRQEKVTFFNLTAFRKGAELLGKYTKKGSRLFVDGRLEARTVTNDKGETRTFHDVVVQDFQFLDRKDETPEARAGIRGAAADLPGRSQDDPDDEE